MGTTRRFMAALLVVMTTMLVAACGGSDKEGGGGASGDSGGTINFLAPEYSDKTEPFLREVIGEFEKANPGSKVKLQMVSWTDINQKVTTLVSTNQAPDVLILDAFANFAGDELLLSADEVLSPKTREDFIEKFAANGQLEGTQYGIPLVGSVRGLFYNREIFKEAGLSDPPKTWDELREHARAIEKVDKVGYGMPLGPEEAQAEFSLFMWGNGGDWMKDGKWSIDQPANVEALEFMNKLANEDEVTQPNPASTNRTDLWKLFGAGRVGMVMGSNFYPVLLKDQNPDLDYAVAPVPVNEGNEPVTLAVEDYLMAFKDTEEKDVVKSFLDYFYSAEVYARFIEAEGFLPVLNSTAEKVAAEDEQQKVFLESVETARFYPTTNPKWGAIAPKVKQDLGSAVTGKKEPQEVLGALQAAAEKE